MARKSFSRVHRGARRQTAWFAGVFQETTVAAGTPVALTSLNAAALALRPFTIVRTHVELFISSDQEAADEVQLGAYGHIVVSDQAVAAGIASLPTPVSEQVSDWFAYQQMLNSMRFGTAVGFESQAGTRYTIDSKAMRKVEPGQDVVSVVEGVTGVSNGFDLLSSWRMLVKLF